MRKRVSERTGRVTYEARWRFADEHGRPQRRGRTFRTKAEAERFLRATNAELHLGTHVDPRRASVSFAEVAEGWQASVRWARLKPTSAARYDSILRVHLLPRWGDRPVGGITPAAVDAWCAELLRGGMPPATVSKLHSTFRAALSVAVLNGYLRDNPAHGITLPRTPQREMLFLTAAEVDALASAVPPRYRALILTAAYGGLRAGELWGLKRGRLDLIHRTLTVAKALVAVDGEGLVETTPKTYERRVISLPPFLVDALDAHLREFTEGGTGPDALVFTSASGSPQAQTDFFRFVFKPAVRAALPEEKHALRFRDLRHTCAALMIATGAHPKLISTRLGHASIGVTMDRYGKIFPALDDAAMQGLEAAHQSRGA